MNVGRPVDCERRGDADHFGKALPEVALFERYLPEARYIGEIGLGAGPRFYRSLHDQEQVVIALSTDIGVAQGAVFGALLEEGAVEPVLQDRADRGDGTGPDGPPWACFNLITSRIRRIDSLSVGISAPSFKRRAP